MSVAVVYRHLHTSTFKIIFDTYVYICSLFFLGKLDADFVFEFSTTPVKLLQFLPYGTTSTLKPKCLLLFNQKIDSK